MTICCDLSSIVPIGRLGDTRSCSSFANRELLLGSLLLSQSNLLFVGSGDVSGLFDNVEFNMAVGGKVGRNSSVSSVGSSSSAHSSLGDNVGNLALFSIQSLGLGVGLQVLEEENHVID